MFEAILQHSDSVNSVAFSLDGRHIISASNDTTAKIWNTVTGECETVKPYKLGKLCYFLS